MRAKRIALLLLFLFISLLFTHSVLAMSSPNYAIEWMVPLSGSGGAASSTNYAVHTTVGQTAIQSSHSPGFQAGLGFWYAFQDLIYDLFMPLIISE